MNATMTMEEAVSATCDLLDIDGPTIREIVADTLKTQKAGGNFHFRIYEAMLMRGHESAVEAILARKDRGTAVGGRSVWEAVCVVADRYIAATESTP